MHGACAERVTALRAHGAQVLSVPEILVFPVYEFPVGSSLFEEIFHVDVVCPVIKDNAKISNGAGRPRFDDA